MRSVGPLLLWSTVGFALLLSAARPVSTNDLDIYLAMGRWMSQHGQLVETETFSWTAFGAPFVNGTWGFSVLAHALVERVDLRGLQLLNGGLVALAVWMTARAAGCLGADRRAQAIAALWAFALMFQNTTVRGQTFVFPLFAGLLWWSVKKRSPAASVVVGVVGGAVWGALHGSFPAGLVALGLLALGGRWQTPVAVAVGLAIGVCIGPYGPAIWLYVLENGSLPRERDFVEWYAPTLGSFEGARFWLAAVLGGLLVARRGTWEARLVFLGFVLLGATGVRFVAWFGLATAPFVASALPFSHDRGLSSRLVRPIEGVVTVMWVVFLVRGLEPRERILSWDTPVELLAALPTEGRIFNPPELGGAIVWRQPDLQISHDVRTWVYDDDAWWMYIELSRAPEDWNERLIGVDHLLLVEDFHGQTLLPEALAHPDWAVVRQTDQGALLRRR